MIQQTLVEQLQAEFSVSSGDLDKAIQYQDKYGGRLEQILVNMGSLPEDQLPQLYAQSFQLPTFDIRQWEEWTAPELDPGLLDFFVEQDWIPLQVRDDNWTFAVKYPLNLAVNEWLESNEVDLTLFIASEQDISHFKSLLNENDSDGLSFDELSGDEEERLRELASEAPTVNLLNSLISRALRRGASDMHLEPFQGAYRVRFRIDGVLHDIETLPPRMQLPIVTRLKILSGMDIAEKRRPQDGKIEMKIANKELDIRVSSMPLAKGESVVMRFLLKESVRYDMEVLGLAPDVRQWINEDLQKTSGVILLTGPTGSGKTTSLYTFLNQLNDDEVKIVTLEDPVEYQLPGVNQVQVNRDIGYDFASGLRSIVRQDPDIIMLGEIRDQETARIAMQSALTGHLVFSTVHTNDAASAYTRLLDLGVEEFLLNAALVSIVAQRLARKVCPHCSEPHPEAEHLVARNKIHAIAERFGIEKLDIRQAKGCEQCGHTGYSGRVAVTEYLRCDDDIVTLPKDSEFLTKARRLNQELGRRNLLQDGLYKAAQGITTIEEVLRVAG
ncbi:general secretion pathway protein E [Idiomarina aquatica]|uniref:General secretion pathway protein E n=1 Tax=Idiomarina aquatica TaxID=1327752 RepID=A0A4V3CQ14_9GAMM|nr:type II/IV secretion system protein [Idiomarina aquatica]TDP40230.1 general secretion pathway protein E [Idiomarina aquatica]